MSDYFFVSDLHGREDRYEKLFQVLLKERPDALFLGGDLLPHNYRDGNFVADYLSPRLSALRKELGKAYPQICLILGNDDARAEEDNIINSSQSGIFHYIHFKSVELDSINIYGYSFTPPSPFLLKDWEKYDVSRYLEPGCISPEEGKRTVEVDPSEIRYSTIQKDLEMLAGTADISRDIILFHAPPYRTNLDRAALDGKVIDHVNPDLHVGSIAIKRFIENRRPHITLHGHIHESARITGSWKDKIGGCYCFSAAHDGTELALVKFNPAEAEKAERILL